tara:strand:+ start:357 stop:557 length:201 start_codon:yes stop_codon:yes gene_type:complete
MQSKKLEELREVLPLNEDDKEVISVAAELIRTLREDIVQLQKEVDVLKQTPPSTPPPKKRKRRWLF